MLAVIARSLSMGFAHGVATTLGIILGDFVYIFLVFYGVAALAAVLSDMMYWVSLFGGVYLIYLGLDLARQKVSVTQVDELGGVKEYAWSKNISTGLLITLSNPKAILFYAGFLPAFINIESASAWDLVAILLAALLSVGASMLAYAYLAARTGQKYMGSSLFGRIQLVAGLMLLGTGIYLIVRAS